MDPHWPYDAPQGFGATRQDCSVCDYLFWSQFGPTTSEQREELRRRYAAEVRYTDAMLGRLYDALGATGTLDHTWLVVTSAMAFVSETTPVSRSLPSASIRTPRSR